MGFCDFGYGIRGMGSMMFLGWIFIAVIMYLLFTNKNSTYLERRNVYDDSALRVLNERYASGEISEEEYQKIRKNIS
ncbi:SHOCT domain-containing protein [Oceanirhabdus sp. W0125-5]|uniref:SHOCT domain-containing protein n=1 Tax=Oceanirhabdus sp. W0125-5 TaxID=2999116 RepID=UPI0022F33223|nr:SHOCT domain-containing protein [Oceanirhabdus sp. W0125-5]WBW95013.1 SHOCT domain-containing protein [Oceanirhabdus sp. W0125-5]